MTFYYFAYGSNMCTGRLRLRVPSACPLFVTRLVGHALRFHKRSDKDGSGKADAEETKRPDDFVLGVVFVIEQSEKPKLDRAEGLGAGYCEKAVPLKDCSGSDFPATMYYAAQSHKNPDLRPYSWYLRFVVEGAKQHALPSDYLEKLEAIEADEDPDHNRDARKRSIRCAS